MFKLLVEIVSKTFVLDSENYSRKGKYYIKNQNDNVNNITTLEKVFF